MGSVLLLLHPQEDQAAEAEAEGQEIFEQKPKLGNIWQKIKTWMCLMSKIFQPEGGTGVPGAGEGRPGIEQHHFHQQ